jgi:hypothetical protein
LLLHSKVRHLREQLADFTALNFPHQPDRV